MRYLWRSALLRCEGRVLSLAQLHVMQLNTLEPYSALIKLYVMLLKWTQLPHNLPGP
jgi:hypothetical protein